MASEVLRDALRLMENQERKLVALDLAVERGMADIEARRVQEAGSLFNELEAELSSLPSRTA